MKKKQEDPRCNPGTVGEEHQIRNLHLLIIDDNPGFLQAASEFLAAVPGVACVACAGSGAEALSLCAEQRFDLVVTDINMPGMNGIETMQRLREGCPGLRMVAVTMNNAAEYRAAALASGALGVIAKNEFIAEISILIDAIAAA